jgi:hypothetical protein
LTDNDVEEVATDVETQLNKEATDELRKKGDAIKDREIDALENLADENVAPDEMRSELGILETEVEENMDAEARKVKASLKSREKSILEERLSKKLGKKVTLMIEEDDIRMSDDDLLQGLTALVPPTTKATPSTLPIVGSCTNEQW